MSREDLVSVKFIYIPDEMKNVLSSSALVKSTSDFRYRGDLENKAHIQLVKEAFGLIKRSGIHENISTARYSFPKNLKLVYSLGFIENDKIPRLDISPIDDEIILSCLDNLKPRKNYPLPRVIEARPDAIRLGFDFAELTLTYSPIDDRELLEYYGGMARREQKWH